MLRPIASSSRRLLMAVVLACAAGLGSAMAAAPATAQTEAIPMSHRAEPTAAMAEEAARAAAERILIAVRSGDAQARFNQFAPSLQRVSSPAMVAESIKRMPRLLSWQITSIQPGMDSSSVEARVLTSSGSRELTMVIDANGKLEGYNIAAQDIAAEQVVSEFLKALTRGEYITASSFLSPTLQEDISQATLQKKWQLLQRMTGNFVRVKKIWKAESTALMKLVIVKTQFNRLTDNLFVSLNERNQIIGVDFPTDPEPSPVPGR
ncbi:MAG: DUF3887 domain-containing protein [Cyanobium sp.]